MRFTSHAKRIHSFELSDLFKFKCQIVLAIVGRKWFSMMINVALQSLDSKWIENWRIFVFKRIPQIVKMNLIYGFNFILFDFIPNVSNFTKFIATEQNEMIHVSMTFNYSKLIVPWGLAVLPCLDLTLIIIGPPELIEFKRYSSVIHGHPTPCVFARVQFSCNYV